MSGLWDPVFKLDCELTSRASRVAQMAQSPPAAQETRVNPWAKRIPGGGDWLLTLVCLLAEFHGQRNLAGYRPWDHKELDMNERLAFSLFFNLLLINGLWMTESALLTLPLWVEEGGGYKEGKKKWKLPDSRRETQVFLSIPPGFVQFWSFGFLAS